MWEYLAVAALVAAPLLVVIVVQAVVIIRSNSNLTCNFERALAAALAVQSNDVTSVRRAVSLLGELPTPRQPSPPEPDAPVPALHVTRE